MSAENIVERLNEGCILHPKRWSGDTHDDLGGSIREDATDELMREAAAEIVRLRGEAEKLSNFISKFLQGPAEAKGDASWAARPYISQVVLAGYHSNGHIVKDANGEVVCRTQCVDEGYDEWIAERIVTALNAPAKGDAQPAGGEAVALVELIEGRGHRWTNDYNLRLKDTPEWVAFYLATKRTTPQPAPVQVAAQEGEALPNLVIAYADAMQARVRFERGYEDRARADGCVDDVTEAERDRLIEAEREAFCAMRDAAHPSTCELEALREFHAAWMADNATGPSQRRLAAARDRVAALQHRGDSQEVGRE